MARPEAAPKTALAARLRAVRAEFEDPERDQWAGKLGVSKNTLASYERGETEPTASVLIAYREHFGINVDWLLSGAGDMFDDRAKLPKKPVTIDANTAQSLMSAAQDIKKAVSGLSMTRQASDPPKQQHTIKLLPFEASAGFGTTALSEHPIELNLEDLALRMFGIYPEDLSIIPVRGDSMRPTLQNGDIAIVDQRQTDIKDGVLYAISLDGEIYVKRAIDDPDAYVWGSDNPAFDAIRVPQVELEKMTVIGRVIWYWRRL